MKLKTLIKRISQKIDHWWTREIWGDYGPKASLSRDNGKPAGGKRI